MEAPPGIPQSERNGTRETLLVESETAKSTER